MRTIAMVSLLFGTLAGALLVAGTAGAAHPCFDEYDADCQDSSHGLGWDRPYERPCPVSDGLVPVAEEMLRDLGDRELVCNFLLSMPPRIAEWVEEKARDDGDAGDARDDGARHECGPGVYHCHDPDPRDCHERGYDADHYPPGTGHPEWHGCPPPWEDERHRYDPCEGPRPTETATCGYPDDRRYRCYEDATHNDTPPLHEGVLNVPPPEPYHDGGAPGDNPGPYASHAATAPDAGLLAGVLASLRIPINDEDRRAAHDLLDRLLGGDPG